MTFSSQIEKGPPNSAEPMRLAGTWKQYSKRATPQLMRMTSMRLKRSRRDLKAICPYQASVMKALEMTSNATVASPRNISICF